MHVVRYRLFNCLQERQLAALQNMRHISLHQTCGEWSPSAAAQFRESREWQELRYRTLSMNDGRCELCGASKHDGAALHVDHIVPLSLDWFRRADPENLQVLCRLCNVGKRNRDNTDWRPAR